MRMSRQALRSRRYIASSSVRERPVQPHDAGHRNAGGGAEIALKAVAPGIDLDREAPPFAFEEAQLERVVETLAGPEAAPFEDRRRDAVAAAGTGPDHDQRAGQLDRRRRRHKRTCRLGRACGLRWPAAIHRGEGVAEGGEADAL